MSAPRDENKVAGESVMSNLMQLNKLTYRVPPSLSVAKERKYVSNYPQQRSYSQNETIVWNVNTGSQFLDAKRSYMSFDLKTPAGTLADFGKGSACNLFDSIRVKSRSGVEISRLEGANLWSNVYQRWNCPSTAFASTLQAQGYGTAIAGSEEGKGTNLALGVKVCIPLHIIPCFNQDRLLPPQLCDGMIIEIALNPVGVALYSVGSDPDSYTISNLLIRWDAYDLADAFDRKIAEMASRDGLNLVHKEYHRTISSGATQDFQFDIKKSASKALGVYVAPRLTTALTDIGSDSNQCAVNPFVRFQFQLGSSYYPQAPMTNASVGTEPTQQTSAEAYYYALASWHKTDCNKPSDVTIGNFSNGVGTARALMGIASTSFVKSQVSDLAGCIVNSARALVCDITCYNSTSRRLDAYLCHARLVKVFQENCVVSD